MLDVLPSLSKNEFAFGKRRNPSNSSIAVHTERTNASYPIRSVRGEMFPALPCILTSQLVWADVLKLRSMSKMKKRSMKKAKEKKSYSLYVDPLLKLMSIGIVSERYRISNIPQTSQALRQMILKIHRIVMSIRNVAQ